MIKTIKATSVVKSLALSISLVATLGMTGCASSISSGISKEGQVMPSNVVFPELNKAWQKGGVFPNSENLSKIRPGISKDSLYQLISYPHFNESQHAQEWDYIFKFYQDDGSVEVCQYKIIFDSDFIARQFYWQPSDCAKYAQPEQAPVALVAPAPIVNEQINLAADALFEFDQWRASDIKMAGRQSLDELATVLRRYQGQGQSRVLITGHTDRLGDDAYNLTLSQQRAQTVRQYLISHGVDANTISATGEGEARPINDCAGSMSREELIECLQPNRRVEVNVTVMAPHM